MGSSPRGRGKLGGVVYVRQPPGLIPAWAGKTPPHQGPGTLPPAHPRVGGENVSQTTFAVRAGGSSPRGRGKRSWSAAGAGGGRLIPAWAGKTFMVSGGSWRRPAHPRVGGENHAPGGRARVRDGSSPRGRGKLQAPGRAQPRDGLIPAWAGKTTTHAKTIDILPAHPRVGGENSSCCTVM